MLDSRTAHASSFPVLSVVCRAGKRDQGRLVSWLASRVCSRLQDDPDATAFIQELVNAKPKDLGEGRQDGGMPVLLFLLKPH